MFRAAARHSRFVRFLRFAIPVGIVAIVVMIQGNILQSVPACSRVSRSIPARFRCTKVVMELPRVSGFTSDSEPYELTARAATHGIATTDEQICLNEQLRLQWRRILDAGRNKMM